MADLISGIRRLNNSNYKYWRSCMQSYLQGQELWSIVGGREATPPAQEDAEEFQKWEAKAGKAMYALKISVEEELLEIIEDADTPKAIWDTYALLFSRTKDIHHRLLEGEQLSTLQQDLSVEDYGESKISSKLLGQVCRRFSLAEIKLATQNFDETLVIGRGGFGKVYKGFIGDEASPVAIKRLDSESKQGAPQFWTEIEMLSKFRHSHLVTLIGYCNTFHEMIIVYEYMPGGTLADRLYKSGRSNGNNSSHLSWMQRLKICAGAARGLEYLHTGFAIQERIIHRDVKSSNILLDEIGEAKISDFGLSKIGPANQPWTHVSTDVKGTFGFLDPEYFFTHKLTRKSDVYAFGVVLFEVLCGRPAVDLGLEEEQWSLARWAKQCIQEGRVQEMVDPSLNGSILENCLSVFTQTAYQCLHDSSKMRPTMAEVVTKLDYALALQEKMEFSEVNSDKVDSSTELEGNFSSVSDDDEQIDGLIQSHGASHGQLNTKPAKRGTLLQKIQLLFSSKPAEVFSVPAIPGSSLRNLNASRGRDRFFILAFEVANTIVSGSNLLQSLSKENIQFLKEQFLYSEAVQRLVSTDMEELLSILAADKREEFLIFLKEVSRFGDMCKDPQWRYLGTSFSRLESEPSSNHKQLRKQAELTMRKLTTLAQHTDELYHGIVTFNKVEKEYQQKLIELEALHTYQRGAAQSPKELRKELNRQMEIVRSLKKKSLWSKRVEEVVEKLVVVLDVIHQEIIDGFGDIGRVPNSFSAYRPQKVMAGLETNERPNTLGAAGLSLRYANIIIQIDTLASRPTSHADMRDEFYTLLPTSFKTSTLRSCIKAMADCDESTRAIIEAQMRETLQWLVPVARDTIKSHENFGWFAATKTGSLFDGYKYGARRSENTSLMRLQTLYHADKQKIDEYILHLLILVHGLISVAGYRGNLPKRLPVRSPRNNIKPQKVQLSAEDKYLLEEVMKRRRPVLGISKSLELVAIKTRKTVWALSKSTGSSPRRELENVILPPL